MPENKENLLNLSLDQVMSDRFGRYSKYIIQDRALPDSRDGLKPVQRRILYSMNDLGLLYNRPFKKSARVVGDVIGKYHPHGDSSIYEAMVRMSQDWKMNMPLIEMHGNNGSIDDDPAAAMRYTEARLAKLSQTLISNIKKDTVKFAPNFDDSEKEPTVFPALLPNLLINGAKGIAAGYATEIPPHNLNEVINAIIAKIKKPSISLDELLKFIKGPDFPTGGTIQGKDGIYEAFERGRGRIVVRSKYETVDLKTKPSITITEIPYGVNKSKLVRDIDEIRFNNKISGIKDVRDESDRKGISILIELIAGTNVEAVLNYLLSKTEMQVYYNYNVIAIKDKVPTQMGLIDLIDSYLNHQVEVQTRALKFDLAKDKTRLEIVEGLIRVADLADKIIAAIKKVKGSKSGVIKMLMSNFKFTKLQATAIAELRLYRLSQTDQSVYIEERDKLTEEIDRIQSLLKSKELFNEFLVEQLKAIQKEYGTERKSIIDDSNTISNVSIDMESLIKHEDVWVGVSKEGYIKRFSNRAYEANNFEDFGLKENDSIKYLSLINTADKLLVFTSKGRYMFIPVHQILETKFKNVGKHVNDFATLRPDEHIVDAISVSDFSLKGYIVQVTKEGRAKATKFSDFEVSRFKKAYKSFKLKDGDEVIGAKISNGLQQIVIVNSAGKAVKYNVSEVPIQGTAAAGGKCMGVKGSKATAFALVKNTSTLGIISKRGGMKRIKVKDITPMAKTTQGKNIFRVVSGNPHVPIDMNIVDTKTSALFFTKKINKQLFKDVEITSTGEGMSLVGPAQPKDGKILIFERVHKDNPILVDQEDIPEEEKFEKAAKSIDAIEQISIEDILKDLEKK